MQEAKSTINTKLELQINHYSKLWKKNMLGKQMSKMFCGCPYYSEKDKNQWVRRSWAGKLVASTKWAIYTYYSIQFFHLIYKLETHFLGEVGRSHWASRAHALNLYAYWFHKTDMLHLLMHKKWFLYFLRMFLGIWKAMKFLKMMKSLTITSAVSVVFT